jgi:hypothetical protein
MVPILIHVNPVHIPVSFNFKIRFNIIIFFLLLIFCVIFYFKLLRLKLTCIRHPMPTCTANPDDNYEFRNFVPGAINYATLPVTYCLPSVVSLNVPKTHASNEVSMFLSFTRCTVDAK